jgi:basic amino acid/polyamine antiporter, APA family
MEEQGLKRRLGTVSATALVVSNMIGTGIFTTSGYLAGDLGSPGLVIGIWFAGALVALAGALCYAELGSNFPRSGGEYVYLTEAWGPAWGFVDGWVSFVAGFSAAIATSALAIASYLGYFYPALDPRQTAASDVAIGPLVLHFGGGHLLGCAVVLLFTAFNVFGVGEVAKLQNFLTGGKLLVLVLFLVLGFAVGHGDWGHFSQNAERTSTSPVASQFLISLVFVYFGYSGWNAAVYVAEEIRDPSRTLPIALVLGTTLVAMFYAALNCLYIYANPLESMKGVNAVGAQASTALFGGAAGGLFAAAMAASLLATVNAMSMVGPRVYYAMARDGAFFRVATRLHPKWKSPWITVIAQGLCCCVLIITGTFESLVYYIGFMLWLFTALSVLALVKFRKRADWQPTRWVSLAYPMIPLLYVSANLLVFVYFVNARRGEAAWSLLTVLGGALLYHLYVRSARRSQPS